MSSISHVTSLICGSPISDFGHHQNDDDDDDDDDDDNDDNDDDLFIWVSLVN